MKVWIFPTCQRHERKTRTVGKEGLSREKPVDTDHDLARDKAQPMLTTMEVASVGR